MGHRKVRIDRKLATFAASFLLLASCTGAKKIAGPINLGGIEYSPSAEARVEPLDEDRVQVTEGEVRMRLIRLSMKKPLTTYQKMVRMRVESLFENTAAPYPGMITRNQKCEDSYLAKPYFYRPPGLNFDASVLFANSRFTEGVCVKAEITHRVYRGILNCESRPLALEIEYFEPFSAPSKIESLLQRFKCAG